jgi:phosphodiester glycosidase
LTPAKTERGASLLALQGIAPAASGAAGGRYTVKEIWPQQAYYAPFPKNEVLLVGRGHAVAWLLHNVRTGMAIDVDLDTDPDWQSTPTVVGGGPLLVQNGRIVDDPYNPIPDERNYRPPVSAVGISQDGKTMLLLAIERPPAALDCRTYPASTRLVHAVVGRVSGDGVRQRRIGDDDGSVTRSPGARGG